MIGVAEPVYNGLKRLKMKEDRFGNYSYSEIIWGLLGLYELTTGQKIDIGKLGRGQKTWKEARGKR